MTSWNSVGILGKPNALTKHLETFKELAHLLEQWKISTYYEKEVGALLKIKDSSCLPTKALFQHSDLILVVGGDGSMLNAARQGIQFNRPLLGINRGRLGFLTDIGPDELAQRLRKMLEGKYWCEERFLLEGKIQLGNNAKHTYVAFNDIVLSLGASSQLIEFDLWVNESFVCRQRADGLIVATPTGSTAYALSAGGPILHPDLEAIAIVPMLPHKLTSRPIVISNQMDIKILLRKDQQGPARVSFDSQEQIDLYSNEAVHIRAYPKKIKLIHPKDYNYFQTLRDKLHWESANA